MTSVVLCCPVLSVLRINIGTVVNEQLDARGIKYVGGGGRVTVRRWDGGV
jgi:hypothetical protein